MITCALTRQHKRSTWQVVVAAPAGDLEFVEYLGLASNAFWAFMELANKESTGSTHSYEHHRLVAVYGTEQRISLPMAPEGVVVTVTKNGKPVKGVPTWLA